MKANRRVLLVTAATALVVGVLAPITAQAASQHITTEQKSQIQFLEQYSKNAQGQAPTEAQAEALVLQYAGTANSVPDMAWAKKYKIGQQPPPASSLGGTTVSGPAAQQSSEADPNSASPPSSNKKMLPLPTGIETLGTPPQNGISPDWHNESTGGVSFYAGLSSAREFGVNQTLNWGWNNVSNGVCCWSTSGYDWVASWAQFWHFDRYVEGNGYPRWAVYGGGSILQSVSYYFIADFEDGYGPFVVHKEMDMQIRGSARGVIWGGYF